MDAHNNITFWASNKIGVGFRCSYKGVRYFNFRINGVITELEHLEGADSVNVSSPYAGTNARGFDYATQNAILLAYAEYVAKEAREYAEWKSRNAKLFA